MHGSTTTHSSPSFLRRRLTYQCFPMDFFCMFYSRQLTQVSDHIDTFWPYLQSVMMMMAVSFAHALILPVVFNLSSVNKCCHSDCSHDELWSLFLLSARWDYHWRKYVMDPNHVSQDKYFRIIRHILLSDLHCDILPDLSHSCLSFCLQMRNGD